MMMMIIDEEGKNPICWKEMKNMIAFTTQITNLVHTFNLEFLLLLRKLLFYYIFFIIV